MFCKNKKYLVFGLGKSGIAAAVKLKELGRDVLAVDNKLTDKLKESVKRLKEKGINYKLNVDNTDVLNGINVVIVSPGIPFNNSLLIEAQRRKIKILSEIEFAFTLANPKKIIAVSGTNGKTTVVSMIKHIFDAAGVDCEVAGNIGNPFISVADKLEGKILVLEVSSFQLHFTQQFKPDIAVLLNIGQDHLDWHEGFNQYIKDKARLFANQTKKDYAIVNKIDPNVLDICDGVKSKKLYFNSQGSGDLGREGLLLTYPKGKICSLNELKITGDHNIGNALCAFGCAYLSGVCVDDIKAALASFNGLEHRIEFVASVNGARYYNDSKATNPLATKRALETFKGNIILLAGGRNKGNSFDELNPLIKSKAKLLIAFGEARNEILSACGGGTKSLGAKTLNQAIEIAHQKAGQGDVVLLSPACASFDEFESYMHRGNFFKEKILKC